MGRVEKAWMPNSVPANYRWEERLLLHRWNRASGTWQYRLFGQVFNFWEYSLPDGAIIHTHSKDPGCDCWLFHGGGDVEWMR